MTGEEVQLGREDLVIMNPAATDIAGLMLVEKEAGAATPTCTRLL